MAIKRSAEEWQELLKLQRQTHVGDAAFADDLGVSIRTVQWWRWRLGVSASALRSEPDFVRVDTTEDGFDEKQSPEQAVEVVFASGVRVRVSTGFDYSELARLIEALSAVC